MAWDPPFIVQRKEQRGLELSRSGQDQSAHAPDEKNSLAKPQEVSEAFPRNICDNQRLVV
jgi:hypothetical protein